MTRGTTLALLVLLVATPVRADVIVGSVRFGAPETPNGGPDRYGVSNLRIEVENTASSSVVLEVVSVKVSSRRVMDPDWTTRTLRVPGGAYLEGEPETGTRRVTIAPGRHTLVTRFESVSASAYHLHVAEVAVRVREGRRVRHGVIELPVVTSRRHPLRRKELR